MSSTDSNFHTHLLVATQQLVTWTAYLVGYFLTVVQWASVHYPNVTRVVESVVIAYIVWRSYVRIMKFWWRLCMFLVKMVLFYLVIFMMLGVYVRGFETFLLKDMYRIWTFINYVYNARDTQTTYVDPTVNTRNPMMMDPSFLSKNKDVIDSVENQFYEVKNHAEEYIKGGNVQKKMQPKLRNVYNFAANLGLF